MPAEAILEITAKGGKESINDKFSISADSAVAVTDHLICANQEDVIDLYAGPKDSICFLIIKSDPYSVAGTGNCSLNGQPKDHIQIAFAKMNEEPADDAWMDLKQFMLVTSTCGTNSLPDSVDQIHVDNRLTQDVKISVLAVRKKYKANGDAKEIGKPARIKAK